MARALILPDPLLEKSDDFTFGLNPFGGETRAVEIWLVIALHALRLLPLAVAQALVRMIRQAPIGAAGRTLNKGFRVEHYRSVLPNHPSEFTPQQQNNLLALNEMFEEEVADFLAQGQPVEQRPPESQVGELRELDLRS